MNDHEKSKEQLLQELSELRVQLKGCREEENQKGQAEKRLLQANSMLRNILDSSSSISIICTDMEGTITYWNTGAENIFGYSTDEVVGRENISILYDPETKSKLMKIRTLLQKNMTGIRCDVREVAKSGRKLWINMSLTPRHDEKGNVIGVLGIGEDITDRKKAEKELQDTFEELQNSLDRIIDVMVRMIEKRDPYTAGHQQRVVNIAIAIAKKMELPARKIEGIRMAANIHDLGKISIPAEILSNPGKLSDIQFEMIKSHAIIGFDILEDIEFSHSIADIICQHHERIDGSGYPNGLKGDEILLEAKIISVADVVEAMASHRPYRAALGIEAALEEIEKYKGKKYDLKVADACLKIFREDGFTIEAS